MAVSYTYNSGQYTLQSIYRTTVGGTVWSADIGGATPAFDYFDDSAVVDDAIYFTLSNNNAQASDFTFNVGTAMAGVDIVLAWEYPKKADDDSVAWGEFEDLEDDTNGFTTLGSNRVKFPLQWRPDTFNLNGLTRTWFRCRIVSLTSISEGGANITDTVKRSDGRLITYGRDDNASIHFQDYYDYMVANYPYISLTQKNSRTFDFTKVGIYVGARTESYNEVVEMGQGCITNTNVGENDMEYLTSGIKNGTRGYNGSTFIVHGGQNSRVIDLGINSKIYGCLFKRGPNTTTTSYPGYCNVIGDVVDSKFEIVVGSASFQTPMDNIVINGGICIAVKMSPLIKDLTYICGASSLLYSVPAPEGWTIENFEYGFNPSITYARVHYFYAYCYRSDTEIGLNYINPSTPLGSYTDNIKPYLRTVGPAYDWTQVKWYRDSSGTFEDYTTEASDATPDNLPLGGEVGDCLYMNHSTLNSYPNSSFYFERTATTNDYEYVWEYYTSAYGWLAMGNNDCDGTDDMSITGYRLGSWYTPTDERRTTITIDGTSAYWMRLRITKKGTGSQMASKLQMYRVYGQGPWAINQKYSMEFEITDKEGNAIEGANVICKYSTGEDVFSVSSDSSGNIERQVVLNKSFKTDGHIEYLSTRLVKETEYPEFDIYITKNGYKDYKATNIPFTGKVDWKISLKKIYIKDFNIIRN